MFLSGWEEVGLHNVKINGNSRMVLDLNFADENVHLGVWNNLSGNEDLSYILANAGYKVVLTNFTGVAKSIFVYLSLFIIVITLLVASKSVKNRLKAVEQ